MFLRGDRPLILGAPGIQAPLRAEVGRVAGVSDHPPSLVLHDLRLADLIEQPDDLRVGPRRHLGPHTAAKDFEWLLAWEAAAASPDIARKLIDVKPTAAPRAKLRLVHQKDRAEWTIVELSLATTLPFALEAACQLWVVPLVMRCDGTKTVREHLMYLRENGALPAETPDQQVLEIVRRLIAGGFLEIPEFRLPRDEALRIE